MTIEVEQLRNINNQLKEMLDKIPHQIEMLRLELSLCDKERSDILHLIELSNFNASEGYRLSRDLQITQRKRREVKNELHILQQIKDDVGVHRPLVHQASSVEKIFAKSSVKKKYTPRVRKDFTEQFRKIEAMREA